MPTMINPDLQPTMLELRQNLFNALTDENATEEQTQQAFDAFFEGIQSEMTAEANQMMQQMGEAYNDEQILVNRGIRRSLTSEEKKYFENVMQHQSFEGLDEVFPETVIEDIFKNLQEEHPLLSRIDSRTTSALMKYIYADPTKQLAFWGTIPDNIRQLILQGFKTLSLESYKLSGFVPVTKGFFELGPSWLANYVITIITEIMTASLEIAIVKGTGKLEPIGMMKKLSGATDGVYPDKEKIPMTELTPFTLAGIRAALADAKTDNGRVAVLVNPMTYWAKLFPALCTRDANGNWHLISLPTGEEIILSHAVPIDTLIFGVPENYLLAVAGQVRIDKYMETLAIEDLDLFIAKFYGNGVAKNANAFFVVDITDMPGATIPELDPDADVQRANVTLSPSETEEEGN